MKQFLALAIMLQLFVGCSNDDNKSSACEDTLPAITTTGANTFGCCINGKLLIPRDGTGSIGGSDKGFKTWGDPSGNNEYSEIEIKDFKSERTARLLIHIQGLNETGNGDYTIKESNGDSGINGYFHTYLHCRIFNNVTNSYQYYRSTENSGVLKIIRYELIPGVRRIVSGTFSCTLTNSSDPTDTIEINNGRFDFDGATLSNVSFP
jgi:hypothetical protein